MNQGLIGALAQFWTIDEKPRLHRRNSYFEDHKVSETDALRFGLVATVLAVAIIVFWSSLGVIL